MDKKLLVSLMMTAPVAAFAQSNWTASGGGLAYAIMPNAQNWTAAQLADLAENGGVLVCPVSAGSISHNAIVPAGSYTFNVESLKNAIVEINGVLQVKRNASGQPVDKDGKVTTDTSKMIPVDQIPAATYTSETTLAFRVLPIDKRFSFEVGRVTISLDFNFATVKSGLQTAFDAIAAFEAVTSEDEEKVVAFEERRDILSEELAKIQGEIDDVDLNNGEALWKAYTAYELAKYNDKNGHADVISKEIKAATTNVNGYNADVAAENLRWANIQKNTKDLKVFRDEIIDLQADLDHKKLEIDKYLKENPETGDLGEYLEFITGKDIDAAQKAIDDYSAAVEAAYADLEKTVNFASRTDAIRGQIVAIDYEQAIADWNAYAEFVKLLPGVQSVYGTEYAKVGNIVTDLGVELLNGVNVFKDWQGECWNALTKIFNNNTGYAIGGGGLVPTNPNIQGAAANLAKAEAQTKERIADMKEVYPDLEKAVKEQQQAWTDANNTIDALQAELDAKKAITELDAFGSLAAKDQKLVNDDIAAIEKALKALEDLAANGYKDHTLDPQGQAFKDAVDKVNAANTKYDNDTAPLSPVLDLMSQLSKAKSYVKAETAKTGYASELADKFEGAFQNISDAIDLFYKQGGDKQEIENAINAAKEACDNLVNAFLDVEGQIKDAQKALDQFNKAIDDKVVVTVNGKPAYNKAGYSYAYGDGNKLTANSVKKDLDGYKADLQAIADGADKYGNPNDAYDAAIALGQKVVDENLAKHVADAQKDFNKKVTDANLLAVQRVAADIEKKTTEAPYATAVGMDALKNAEIELPEDYDGAKNATEAAADVAAAGTDAKKLAACDGDLEVLAAAYNAVYAKIQLVVDNYDAWEDLGKKLDNAQAVLDGFNPADLTIEPAVAYYDGLVKELQKRIDAAEAAVDKSYNKSTEVKDQGGHQATIEQIVKDIKATEAACIANQEAYDAQIFEAQKIADNINALINYLNAHNHVISNLEDYIEDINGVTTDLGALNVDITAAFAKGESATSDFKDRFKGLQDRLDAITDAESQGYLSAVKAANEAYLSTVKLGQNQLDKQYTDAINLVNEYRYDITNAGYYKALINNETFQKNHNALQDCYKKIADLNAELSTFTQGLTAGDNRDKWVVLEYQAVPENTVSNKIKLQTLITEASNISTEIAEALKNLQDASKQIAEDYYAGRIDGYAGQPGAQNVYDTVVDRLVTAGFTNFPTYKDENGNEVVSEVTKAIAPIATPLNAAIKSYNDLSNALNTAAGVHNFILGMSGIADELDKVLAFNVDSFVYKAINDQWNAEYKAAVEALDAYLAEVDNYTQASSLNDVKNAIADALDNAWYLDYQWSYFSNRNKENKFGEFSDQLDSLLEDIKALVETAKQQHELAVKNDAALKELVTNADSYANKTQGSLDDLLGWSGYHDDQLATIEGLQNRLDALVSTVEGDADRNANLDAYKNQFTGVQKAIAGAYKTVFEQEVGYAQSLMIIARTAFNDAKVAGVATDVLDGYDAKIKAIVDALGKINYSADKKDDLRKEVLGYEDQLSDIIAELQGLAETAADTLAETVAALNGEYDRCSSQLGSFKNAVESQGDATGTYGAAVKAEYGPQVEKFIEELNALNSAYLALGVDVIPAADEYSYMMGQISEQATALRAEWQKKQNEATKKYDSDQTYDRLNAEVNALLRSTQYAYDEAYKYHANAYESRYNEIIISILGQEADPENGLEYVQGLRRQMLEMKNSYSFGKYTSLYSLNQDLENDVNIYVRETLTNAATRADLDIQDYGYELIQNIQFPGVNADGWQQVYYNAAAIISEIEAEISKAENLMNPSNADGINSVKYGYLFDQNGEIVWYYAKTDDMSIEAYEAFINRLNVIDEAIKTIEENAEEDKVVKGDLDGDKKITVLDVQRLIAAVGDGVEFEPGSKDHFIHNLNSDNVVNVADVTALIDIMMHGQAKPTMALLRSMLPAVSGNNSVKVIEVEGQNGLRRFAVVLNNDVAFTAGQLDILLPGHARIEGVSVAERSGSLETFVFDNGNSTRVILTSMQNDLIEGNNGAVLFIDVDGNAEVELENVIFSDANANAYYIGEGTTTGVSGVLDAMKDGVKAIYNAAGQKLNGLSKGVNIVRNADGTVTKKIGK